MTIRRVDAWHPPTTPLSFWASGAVLLIGTFLPTNDSPGVTAAVGAGLMGLAAWRRVTNQCRNPAGTELRRFD